MTELEHPAQAPANALRDIKLKLPMAHVVRLQSMRLLRRTSVSHVLVEALDHYFATSASHDLDAVRRQVGTR